MDCYEFQDKVSAYIEKELTLSDVNRFDQHVESCGVCAVAYRGVKASILAVRGSERVSVSSGFNDRLLRRLKSERAKSVNRLNKIGRGKRIYGYEPRYAFASLAAVAAIVVLSVGLLPEGDNLSTPNPLPLSTQQSVNDAFEPMMRGAESQPPSFIADETEDDSLRDETEKRKQLTPADFGGKIRLVKDKKK